MDRDRAHQRHHRDDAQHPQHRAGDPPGAAPQDDRHHDRPQQVELLFHREAPQVPERGEVTGGGVARPHPDLEPVRHVEEASDQVTAHLAERLRLGDRRPDRQSDHHGEERRQQPSRPTHPERAEVDAPVALALSHEQQRDEIARDHEEHLDTEETAGQPRRIGVVDHHRDHGERAQTIEPRQVGHAADRHPAGTLDVGRRGHGHPVSPRGGPIGRQ